MLATQLFLVLPVKNSCFGVFCRREASDVYTDASDVDTETRDIRTDTRDIYTDASDVHTDTRDVQDAGSAPAPSPVTEDAAACSPKECDTFDLPPSRSVGVGAVHFRHNARLARVPQPAGGR